MAGAPARWDLEADVVSIGSGLGGLTAAIVAHDRGRRRAWCSRRRRKLGGLSGFGGGEVFVPANHKMRELGLADTHDEGRAVLRVHRAPAIASPPHQTKLLATMHEAIEYSGDEGRRALEGLPGAARLLLPATRPARRLAAATSRSSSSTRKTLGEWQQKTWLTPIMPPGALHEEMYAWGGLAKVTTWDYELLGKRIAEDQRTLRPGHDGLRS